MVEVVGTEIGLKMRSAIKAKLTELGCYVDDELPDYVMVMVANKRSSSQMEEDLQLFLGDNTVLFVSWLHHVLKKLQQVTLTTSPVPSISAISPSEVKVKTIRSESKDRNTKEKKEKKEKKKSKHSKDDEVKKSKKRKKNKKNKDSHKKSDKKVHKHKKSKKSKHNDKELIRPNVPPLLMNLEMNSEPSITDIFAGQILKNHGITLTRPDSGNQEIDIKPFESELSRPLFPVSKPATITSQELETSNDKSPNSENAQVKHTSETEDKLINMRHKLVQLLDTISDDEDIVTIGAESDELMKDFADDMFQNSNSAGMSGDISPPIGNKVMSPPPATSTVTSTTFVETLPLIELNLPKRPAREKIKPTEDSSVGFNDSDILQETEKSLASDKDLTFESTKTSLREYSNDVDNKSKNGSMEKSPDYSECFKRNRRSARGRSPAAEDRGGPASVVTVRPRTRPSASTSNLLMRAVADAQKSLHNIPPKIDSRLPAKSQPAHRSKQPHGASTSVDSGSLLIQIDNGANLSANEEYVPEPITKVVISNLYTPTKRSSEEIRLASDLVVNPKDIHHGRSQKGGTQFVVTLEGLDPNMFLANKLKSEGLLDDEEELVPKDLNGRENSQTVNVDRSDKSEASTSGVKKRISDTSEDSDTQVILQAREDLIASMEKRRNSMLQMREEEKSKAGEEMLRKRKGSPISYEVTPWKVSSRQTAAEPEATSAISNVASGTTKCDSGPSLCKATGTVTSTPRSIVSTGERKPPACRTFPMCRYGAACAFTHPPCKFASACTRRGCAYAHPSPAASPSATVTTQAAITLASHVVPAANYKTISTAAAAALPANQCRFYPNCTNPTCHYFHPKPCRYGRSCANKADCNFYHFDAPAFKWRNVM